MMCPNCNECQFTGRNKLLCSCMTSKKSQQIKWRNVGLDSLIFKCAPFSICPQIQNSNDKAETCPLYTYYTIKNSGKSVLCYVTVSSCRMWGGGLLILLLDKYLTNRTSV
jgi:hypothetical protein